MRKSKFSIGFDCTNYRFGFNNLFSDNFLSVERLAREQFEQEENEEAERKAAEKEAAREEGNDYQVDCRLITYWPARSICISGAFRRNSRRASPVNKLRAIYTVKRRVFVVLQLEM